MHKWSIIMSSMITSDIKRMHVGLCLKMADKPKQSTLE